MGSASSTRRRSAKVDAGGWPTRESPGSSTRRRSAKVDAGGWPTRESPGTSIDAGGGPRNTSQKTNPDHPEDAIAIIGIGCCAPGADNIRDYWRVLQNGECHVTDVPADRWNAKAFLDKDPKAPGKAYVQKGGFIKDVDGFDNGLYGINDYEAGQMDPQQCQLLQCTTMALQDAGITTKDIAGTKTGVFVGGMNNDYGATFIGKTSKGESHTATGISNTILASRLAYVFHLLGPCLVLDTACSVSIVAIHLACQAISSGDCEMAICGGVNCLWTPDMYIALSKARMISPTGLCHTFSDKADGYIRSEGCGVVILKPLKDALRDGDKVWATVCTGNNQNGHTVTPMTNPSGIQQKKLLTALYDKFHVNVGRIDYIEAHGTGTPTGDPVEVNALGSFFKERGPPQTRYIGSVKTNIGHTESAAGVLGLIKVLLMFKHNTIVPSLHCDVVNPKLNLSDYNFVIPTKPIPWTAPQKVAALNSFGFGGSNAHAVVTSFVHPRADEQPRTKSRCIVCFSGKTKKSLEHSLKDFYTDEESPLLDVRDVAYTSTVRRDHYPYRAAFIADDMDDLISAVGEYLDRDRWAPPAMSRLNVVFVFCGMGTAWEGMCQQLLDEHHVFRDTVKQVEKHLSAYVPWSLTKRLQKEDPSKDPILGPVAIFTCQVGLARVWHSLGTRPTCVVGQSIGEVAAAHVAGCLSLSDAVKIIFHRSQLLAEAADGAMMVVQNVEVDKVREILNGASEKASIALQYSPKACAISADSETMVSLRPQLMSALKAANKDMRLINLDVSVAYHSPHVEGAAVKLNKMLQSITPTAPQLPLISTVTGEAVAEPPRAEHWADNVKKPVLFHQAVMKSVSTGDASSTVFLEIGPRPVLGAHMRDLFPGKQFKAVPSVMKDSEMKTLYQSIATLYECGVDIDWRNLPVQGLRVTSVPRYAFDKKHLKEKTEQELVLYGGCDIYRKNHLYVYPTDEVPTTFRLMLSPVTVPSVYQHVVMGKIIVPGALYAECGFAVARYLCPQACMSVSAQFEQLLPLRKAEVVGMEVLPIDVPSGTGEMRFAVKKKDRQLATLQMKKVPLQTRELVNLDAVRLRCREETSKETIYKSLRKSGFEYGAAFSLLEKAYKSTSECLAILKLNDMVTAEMTDTNLHPCILDCMLQSTVLIVGSSQKSVKEMLPKSINGLSVFGKAETEMYVHARLKSAETSLFTFRITLLSVGGGVIAELKNFAVQALMPQEENQLPAMLAVQWEKVKDFSQERIVQDDSGGAPRQEGMLLISEFELKDKSSTMEHMHFDSVQKDLEGVLTTKDIRTLVFLVAAQEHECQSSDALQSKLIDICILIQYLFKVLNDRSLRTPVYVCTFHAWPGPSGSQVRDVRPAETAVWGLLRSAIDESVYSSIVAVEVQVSSPQHMTSKSFQSLMNLLETDKDVAGHPEILIDETAIYVNQVSQISENISVPRRRFSSPPTLEEVHGHAVVLSNDTTQLHNLHAVRQKTPSPSELTVTIRVQTFALPPEKLLNMKVPSEYLLRERTGFSGDHVVMALEVTGQAKDGSDQRLTSCCPLMVGPQVTVPTATVVTTDTLPKYEAGDLSKLVLFWSLVGKASAKQFTVLASRDRAHLAELVKLLSCNGTERTENDVNIVLVEELKEDVHVHDTVLSLVLVDIGMLSMIAAQLKNPSTLVSFACQVTSDLQAFLACTMPSTDLCLLQTQLIFQQNNLQKVVPSLKDWMEKNKHVMPEVSRCLHQSKKEGCDTLTQFKSMDPQAVKVHLEEEGLFKKDGTYLVVGGLTGLGWICVEFLAQNNAGNIVIINRRAASTKQVASMEELSCLHDCKIESHQADICSLKSLEQVLDSLADRFQHGPLRGVFSGAAVLQDGIFPTLNRSAFETVLAPKVQGTWNLHQLTKDMALDYFVMHSSVASVLGNMGQTNYSAANGFLDGLAFHRRHLGLPAQTINWGPLDTGLLDNQDTLKKKLSSMGFQLASQQEIREALPVLMLLNWPQCVPVDIDKQAFANRIQRTRVQPLVSRFRHLIASPTESSSIFDDAGHLDQVRRMAPAQRLEKYKEFVQQVATRVLCVEQEQVTSEVNLYSLGLDSVTGMMMISVMERVTSFKISTVTVLTAEVTVNSLAGVLDECASESLDVE